jgi:hypothetical protein
MIFFSFLWLPVCWHCIELCLNSLMYLITLAYCLLPKIQSQQFKWYQTICIFVHLSLFWLHRWFVSYFKTPREVRTVQNILKNKNKVSKTNWFSVNQKCSHNKRIQQMQLQTEKKNLKKIWRLLKVSWVNIRKKYMPFQVDQLCFD